MFYFLLVVMSIIFLPLQSAHLEYSGKTQLTDINADCLKQIAWYVYPIINEADEIVDQIQKKQLEIQNKSVNGCFDFYEYIQNLEKLFNNDFSLCALMRINKSTYNSTLRQ